MFVVPVRGDRIKTKDDSDSLIVTSYSSLKDEPAVYLKPSTSRDPYVYFSDIVEINGVAVEYDTNSKTFNALGPLRRKFNIPQPKDVITVKLMDVSFKDETEDITVTQIKLHSKKYGIGQGLLICGENSGFTLPDILDVKSPDVVVGKFDPEAFQKFYLDYCPIGLKKKS